MNQETINRLVQVEKHSRAVARWGIAGDLFAIALNTFALYLNIHVARYWLCAVVLGCIGLMMYILIQNIRSSVKSTRYIKDITNHEKQL